MIEREKVQKAFNQCTDALFNLDQKSILKVFHLLSVQFDIVQAPIENQAEKTSVNSNNYLPKTDVKEENQESSVEIQTNSKKQNTTKKSKSNSSKGPTFLSDFDFRPPGKTSLKDFYDIYKSSTNYDNNLIFIYYLTHILEEQVSEDLVYSCYRSLGLKIPSFPSTLNDTSRNKGWIDTSNYNDLKLTRSGINFLEHEMLKKNAE